MRGLVLLAALGGLLLGQSGIGQPLAGYIRDAAGGLRPVFGIAGNLVVGEPVAEGIVAAGFSGRSGWARTSEGIFRFAPDGRLRGPVGQLRLRTSPLALASDSSGLVLRTPGGSDLRVDLSGPVLSIEQMGDGWFHVRQTDRSLAVRARDGRLEVYRLPEKPS